MRVVIVGAGLGGLAAGIAVRRAGHEVLVLERVGKLRETGAGIAVLPNGVLALDALGLGGPVRDMAARVDLPGGLRNRHGAPLLTVDQAAVAARCGAPVAVVRRTWLHRLLAAELPAGAVRTGAAVRALHEQDGRVHLSVDGQVEPADAVVVADGAASALRADLFPGHPGLVGSGEHAARGIAPVVSPGVVLAPGEMLDDRTGDRFGCMPMADGAVYWYSTWRVPAPAESQARHRWLLDRRADWHPCAAALIDATDASEVHVVESMQLVRPLPTLAVGRIALLGDAAHAMTPDLGQGGCQAFEDAVALGAVLVGTRPADVATALSRFDARRRPHTSALQRQARRTNRMMTLTGPSARARDTAFRLVPGALATRAMAWQFRFDPAECPVRADPYAGLVGRWYSFYIRHPWLACRVGSAMWGSDFAPMYQRLARLAELPAGVTVLDAACGAGLALHWLDPSAVARYTGVDASPSMLARARGVAARRGLRKVTFELADIADIPFGDGTADVCLLFNALHCVPDPPGAVAEVTRCLTPGGRLIGSMLIRGGSPRADRLLAREAGRSNGTAGPGGTLDDLERCCTRPT